ncbi:Na+/alanine symporter [uncultured Ruminococcus sp.]|uniref:alanine/glycine:cation symporter family protein n=1 Tax=Massiliimalia timonensis TaxID=1987501 RepID=UPI0008220E18|nr:alanine/glycine:cation symporter family protein [Massiliimalia timonensis]MBS7175264.1 alanine:cation symporter family protein [Clostridiales bacterium]SCH35424.1 Na+/alanine symporter [uncultured Ruminococcus sp.]SCH37608.1 Na+/alanine symporter [uncultured Clostridium sp.]
MEWINAVLGNISDFMYTYILIIMLVLVGLYFSFRTKFIQFRMFPEAIRVLSEKKKDGKDISSFQALMISTASRVGTGNIAGVATAVAASTAIGGYGAIFWMWLLALIGAASAFIESTLAQLYKQKRGTEFIGGPAYYIQKALKSRKWGVVFSILLIACFAYGFNALQAFNAGSSLNYYIKDYNSSIWPWIVGGILALLTALVIFGGVHRISRLVSGIVPVMAVIYIGLGLFITIKNIGSVPEMFGNIFSQAFNFEAIFGGFAGSCVMQGIKRGLYSNEAGMGSAPNAAAAADVSHPVKQGLVQMLSVFIDTILICSTTAFMLLLSGVPIDENVQGMDYVQKAVLNQVGEFGPLFITISIFLFAFSSLVGNYYYTESNFKFIRDSKTGLLIFRISCVAAIFIGALMDFTTVWTMADILMGLMAMVNLVVIFLLGKKALIALKDYCAQKKEGKNPVFREKDVHVGDPEVWDEKHAQKWESD